MFTKWIVQVSSRLHKLKKAFWRPIYNFLARRFPQDFWQFMNHGYIPGENSGEVSPDLPSHYEFQRFPLQMYHFLALKGPISGKDVLEVGSGRGGGANYLYHHLQPASYTAIDYAEDAVNLSNQLFQGERLRYQWGDAENLPFGDEQFDMVLNVESSFLYSNIQAFFQEVKRVMRPGGKFLYADLRFTGQMEALNEEIQKCGLQIVSMDDISNNVLNSLDQLDGIYMERIKQHVPLLIRPFYKEFAGAKGSEFYNELKRGDRRYFRYVLQKA